MIDLKGKRIVVAYPIHNLNNGYTQLNWVRVLEGLSKKYNFHFEAIDFLKYKQIWGREKGTKLLVDEIINNARPDILISHITSDHCCASELQRLRKVGIKTINIFFEGAHCFDSCAKEILSCFDLWTDLYLPGLDRYAALGAKVIWLPVGINSDFIKTVESKKYSERIIDVSFVGSCYYPERVGIMRQICDSGVNVQVHGPLWEELSKTHPQCVKSLSMIPQTQMYKIYADSKIVINFSDIGNPNLRIIRGRDFEATVCGALLITGRLPGMEKCFTSDEIVCYEKQEEIPGLVKQALDNKEASALKAGKGRLRTLSEHTWQNRFEYLLDYYFKEVAK